MAQKALFLSYTPALAPLLQAQGIPHIKELTKQGIEFTLLTFENSRWTPEETQRAKNIRASLAEYGIDWHILRYRPVPRLPGSTWDILRGAVYATRLARRQNIQIVQTRSYIPGSMALFAKKWASVKFIFDMRGFMPDEYVFQGVWTAGGWQYRYAKRLEKKMLHAADSIIVVCQDMQEQLIALCERQKIDTDMVLTKLAVIPNCTDLKRFCPDSATRQEMRQRYGLADTTVFLWLVGGIASWHMPQEVLHFFKRCKRFFKSIRLLVLTQTPNASAILEDAGLSPADYLIHKAAPEEVARLITMADVGLDFKDPKVAGAPVKIGEYLGSGIPVVVNAHQTEIAGLLTAFRAGVSVQAFSPEAYETGARELACLLANPDDLQARCRTIAERHFSLEIAVQKYAEVYRNVSNPTS